MSSPETTPVAFHTIPWRLSDAWIPIAALAALRVQDELTEWTLSAIPTWLLPVLSLLPHGLMLWFAFWTARRRAGRMPALPPVRRILVETAVAGPMFLCVGLVAGLAFVGLDSLAVGTRPIDEISKAIGETSESRFTVFVIVLAVGFGPAAEEFLFRGVILNALCQRMPFVVAALLQGIVFGFIHSFGWVHALAATVLGFGYALVYRWRKSLITPIAMHMMQNLLFVTVALATHDPPNPATLGVVTEAAEHGCRITEVTPDSAAQAAGLATDDVIVDVDGRAVAAHEELRSVILGHKPGDELVLTIVRKGKRERVSATLRSHH